MARIRVSVSGLMVVVGLFALEFAALRSGSRLWFSAVYTFTVLLLLLAVVAAKYGRRDMRAFWFGFSIFGWGYLLLVLGPWTNSQFRDSPDESRPNSDLLTSRWIDTSLHLIRGNGPEDGFGGTFRSATDDITEFAECTTGLAHLMVTLALALLGGYIALVLRGRRTRPRDGRAVMSKRTSLVSLALVGLVCSFVLGAAAYDHARAPETYFPDLLFRQEKSHNDFIMKWYSKHLSAMKEGSLLKLSRVDRAAKVYRLLWLPSFHHPASFRIVKTGNAATLRLVVLDGAGGYDPGQIAIDRTIKLTPQEWDELERRLAQLKFWTMPTRLEDDGGSDGAQLFLEGVANGNYHAVDRWMPDPQYLDLCRYIVDLPGFLALRKSLDSYNTPVNGK